MAFLGASELFGNALAKKVVASDCLTPLLRYPNRLNHHPLHLLHAHQRLQNNTELNRAEFQRLQRLGKIPRRQRLFVRTDAQIVKIGKAPLQAGAIRQT